MSATSVSVNACHTNNISHFHTRGRTNRLDGQIVSDEQIVRCANRNEQIFPRRFARRDEHNLRSGVFFTTVRHKFTSDGQMPDDLLT